MAAVCVSGNPAASPKSPEERVDDAAPQIKTQIMVAPINAFPSTSTFEVAAKIVVAMKTTNRSPNEGTTKVRALTFRIQFVATITPSIFEPL